ncbi:MAG TPA: HAMP domain-containing sensor histidine kinase [Gaiellaceae bacterium]|nr:HAMP domain-containing sensor histidine kinase [Gaiellaceae bacterium]
MLSRLSLRARLVLGVIVLSAVGLAIANVATYASLRSFLFDRTDTTLVDSSHAVEHSVFEHGRGCGGPGDRPPPGVEPGDYAEVRSSAGQVVCSWQGRSFGEAAPSPPVLPADLDVPSSGEPRSFNVDAQDGGSRYRVRASAEPSGQGTVVVATSLADVDATLNRLLAIELLVTAAVLIALALLGLWVVRLGLRPLDAIGDTAAAIAAGDLTRRVERAEPNTEVGRLGLALNAMLGQIESAFKAREATERRLRRFVADASHELRTPLAAVRAYAELFGRGADRRPDDLERAMSGISRESERMSILVEDLLLLARLDEGRPLTRELVELDGVVGEAVETAGTVEPDRPFELDSRPVTVLGDRDRLRQIVDNLLANIRSHTPAGSPVRVRVGPENGHAVIEVEDSGPGMSADEAERVFERFYRADRSRSRSSGGVGLGLSIVAAVAEAHGGTVSAYANGGHGATFRIELIAHTNGGPEND